MCNARISVPPSFLSFNLPKIYSFFILSKFAILVTIFSVVGSSESRADNECDCGWRNLASKSFQIVGGNETGINEFPAMVGIVSFSTKSLVCGGHIISDRYLLSAAHCVFQKDPNELAILAGDHNITSGDDTLYSALYNINAYEIHPDYDSSIYANDIAILQTTKSIAFSQYVAPICLPFKYVDYDFSSQPVIVLGWGQLEFSGPTSDVLMMASLNVLSNDECSIIVSEALVPEEMCTFASGKDSCQLDSGGPLLWTDVVANRMHLVGIISHGLGCASNEPSVNTRVTQFLSWIVERTSDATYCYM
ncbi:venom serine protease 34 [Dendroctonus ponderosae]|uniref:venom serine protease 34 n=1 Tax=Dendroctonus ponderosae TaxID=77166 RepID=UPI00203542E7|nr:venom serine protease 34 [Dendroctonus ponderosae]KAH1027471.1 hypothetical protein HUJ05_000973 [Dendroctonus ponderosae]